MHPSLSGIIVIALSISQVIGSVRKRATCTSGHTTANAACCSLFPVVDFLQENLFDGGECGEDAHSALNLAFHDAIGFSIHGGKGGGADGSLLDFDCTELQYQANAGMDDILARQLPIFETFDLTSGDFIHLAAAVGISNCPGAPRLEYMFGRPAPVAPAPDLTVPKPTDSTTAILARFADAGFSPQEVVALLSAHSIGAASVIDPSVPGSPFDSTPAVFDTQFFLEVLLRGTSFTGNESQTGEVLSPIRGEIRLQSDFSISRDPRTACFWQSLVNNQNAMSTQFKAAMAKLQVLGQEKTRLIDCSDVIPVPQTLTGPIKFPPSFSRSDLEVACATIAFPSLSTIAGAAPSLSPVPRG